MVTELKKIKLVLRGLEEGGEPAEEELAEEWGEEELDDDLDLEEGGEGAAEF